MYVCVHTSTLPGMLLLLLVSYIHSTHNNITNGIHVIIVIKKSPLEGFSSGTTWSALTLIAP